MQRDRRKRLAKQHLAGAEDSVDAVYMALAGAAHAQANAAGSGGAWSSARLVAEDYVDAVYMVLAAAARTQASAERTRVEPQAGQLEKGLALRAEDYVDAVYMVLAAAARTQRATLRKLGNSKKDWRFAARPMPAQARSLAGQAAGSPAASDGAALAWNPFKGSTANGTLNPKSLYLGWLGRANLLRDASGLGEFIPERATTSAHPKP